MNNQQNPSKFSLNRSAAMQELWQDPLFRARQEQHTATRSEAQRKRWQDPEYRTRVQASRRNNAGTIMLRKMQKNLKETLGLNNAG